MFNLATIHRFGMLLLALLVIAGAGQAVMAQDAACTPAFGGLYRVQTGDTLSALALQFGLTVEELQVMNCLQTRSMLQIGQELVVPPGSDDTPAGLLARYTYRYCQDTESEGVICRWARRYGHLDAEETTVTTPGLQTQDQLRDQTCTRDCVPDQTRDQLRDQLHDCTQDCEPAGDANQNRNGAGGRNN